jgi:excisionase family DNA binding protein
LALAPREAARLLSVSPRTLWSLTKSGAIPHVVIGGDKRKSVRYPVAMLQAWLVQNAQGTAEGQR